jgi:SAM-dependent methyltransferase
LVDIGSGQGDLLADLTSVLPSIEALGLELSAEGVRVGAEKVPNARFVQRDLLTAQEVPPEYEGWATHAVCSEVLEHVERPEELLRNALPFLAPGCRVVITVPGGPMSKFDKYIGHRQHFTKDSLRSTIARAGLRVDHIYGAGFPTFNLYKLVVIARGDRLVDDVKSEDGAEQSRAAKLAMGAFTPMFRAAFRDGPWGWQLAATATRE